MSLITPTAACEILDVTRRHLGELVADGEIRAVDVARQRHRAGVTIGADGKTYQRHKPRLRIDAQSVAEFIARRTVGRPAPRSSRRRRDPDIIEFV